MSEHSIPPAALLRHASFLRALARGLLQDSDAAEDVVQDTWVAALEAPPKTAFNLRGWLGTVTRHFAIRAHRAEERRELRERAIAVSEAVSAEHERVDREELLRTVTEAVLALQEPYRSTILLRYFEGLDASAIASTQRVSLAAVRSRLQRAHALLRARLDKSYGEDRNVWSLALLGLTGAGTHWREATLGSGVIVMSVKMKLAAAGVLLLAGWVLWQRPWRGESVSSGIEQSPGPPELARNTEMPAEFDHREGRAPLEARSLASRSEVAEPPGQATVAGPFLRGRVQDPAGASVSGAEVGAEPYDFTARRFAGRKSGPTCRSGADGGFELPSPEFQGRILADTTEWTTVMPCPLGRLSEDAIVVVGRRRHYGGTVVDESGRGLPNVALRTRMSEKTERAMIAGRERESVVEHATTSDADGRFDLPDVGWTDELELMAESVGYRASRLALPDGSDRDLRIQLTLDDNLLVGSVVDAESRPAPAATVFLDLASKTVDDGGRFAFPRPDLSTGHTLVAVKAGYLPARQSFGAAKALPEPLVLVLGGPPLSIRGRTVDERGAAIVHASVWIADKTYLDRKVTQTSGGVGITGFATAEDQMSGTQNFWKGATSGEDGNFEIPGLLPRAYTVCASDPDTLAIVSVPAVDAGTSDLVIVVEEKTPARRVAGRVLSLAGTPIPGLRVFVSRSRESGATYVHAPLRTDGAPVTDAEGGFVFERLHVEDSSLRFAGKGVILQDEPFELDPGQDLEHLVFHFAAACSLQVRLVDPAEADEVIVRSEAGKYLTTELRIGNTMGTNQPLTLVDGVSEVFRTSEEARYLELLKAGKEVRRVPIRLAAGEVTTVRP
jgi:RNA polymerase sigma-70 factor (ECF subfamily)